MGVKLHEDDVANVEKEEDECFVPLELSVPGKPDEDGNGETVDQRVSRERTPVQVQSLTRQHCTQSYDDEDVEHGAPAQGMCLQRKLWCDILHIIMHIPWFIYTHSFVQKTTDTHYQIPKILFYNTPS